MIQLTQLSQLSQLTDLSYLPSPRDVQSARAVMLQSPNDSDADEDSLVIAVSSDEVDEKEQED